MIEQTEQTPFPPPTCTPQKVSAYIINGGVTWSVSFCWTRQGQQNTFGITAHPVKAGLPDSALRGVSESPVLDHWSLKEPGGEIT